MRRWGLSNLRFLVLLRVASRRGSDPEELQAQSLEQARYHVHHPARAAQDMVSRRYQPSVNPTSVTGHWQKGAQDVLLATLLLLVMIKRKKLGASFSLENLSSQQAALRCFDWPMADPLSNPSSGHFCVHPADEHLGQKLSGSPGFSSAGSI